MDKRNLLCYTGGVDEVNTSLTLTAHAVNGGRRERRSDVGRKAKRRKRQPPRWPRQLNYDGSDLTTKERGEEGGLTSHRCVGCGAQAESRVCPKCGRICS